MTDLSVVIPARNEMFLAKTVENILENIEGNTEIIAVMDGYWTEPRILDNPKVIIIHNSEAVGQRAATNQGVSISKSKYVMKCDAHCAFDKGFDVKMIREMHDDWTMAPLMKNLHAFDWVCPDGHRRYQGPSGPCKVCGKETVRDMIWMGKASPNSVSYCFDSTPHFQYFGAYAKRPQGQGEVTETMSLQGSCWMLTRDKYWELNVCDENFGSWGSQGIEVAVKTWLSGGRVMVNKKTWYAHMFRTQGGDFGFPYPIKGSDQEKAKVFARDLFFNNKWPLQKRPLSWLVEKFWPVPGWTEEDLKKLKANTFRFSEDTNIPKPKEAEPVESAEDASSEKTVYEAKNLSKEIIFYTDHKLNLKAAHEVQTKLKEVSETLGIPITSVSIKEMSFGDKNIFSPEFLDKEPDAHKQILEGIRQSKAEVIFICGKDVLYSFSHFEFSPPEEDLVYLNKNISGTEIDEIYTLCGNRDILIKLFEGEREIVRKTWKSEIPIKKVVSS